MLGVHPSQPPCLPGHLFPPRDHSIYVALFPRSLELLLFLLISKTGSVAFQWVLRVLQILSLLFFSPDNYTCYYCNQESKADKVRTDKVKIMIDVCIIYAQTVLKCETEMLISCSKKGYIKINYMPILPARSDFEN